MITTIAHDWREHGSENKVNEDIFATIAQDIEQKGYSISPSALPDEITAALSDEQQKMHTGQFTRGGIGRGNRFLTNDKIRSDSLDYNGLTGRRDLAGLGG